MNSFYQSAGTAHIKKERAKARELRKTRWWRQKLSDGNCYYCEQKFEESELTADHKVPLARGGKSSKGNMVACCKTCNSQKKTKTPAEMALEEL